MIQTRGYAAKSAKTPLTPFNFTRREPTAHDVQMDILYCGVCHSDIHQARNEWHSSTYPMVPGHEIVGKVTKVGDAVKKFKIGDVVAVGCLVDACRECADCEEGLEQYCSNKVVTYNGVDVRYGGGPTYGGYSNHIVVDERFVLSVPKNLNLQAAAPLLCAGITTYSPLRHWKIGKGQKVGIVGLGGLGHMGVKFAHAMGAQVVMITTSAKKAADAKKLGADGILLSTDTAAMKQHEGTFDFILNTIPVGHDVNPYLALLKRDKTMVIVGAVEPLPNVNAAALILSRKNLAGSLIGGLPETQEMLNFCGKHNIVCEIEMIPIQDINKAYERMLKNDVKYRFVIDMATV